MARELEDSILRALRRITRAIDLHSRWLATNFGLTGPQLVCLRTIGAQGRITPSELAREVSLSQATVTGIIDRLTTRQLVSRERSNEDRRVVTISLAPAGEALIREAPSPLQERFVQQLAQLSAEERGTIRETLERVVEMMGGEELAAAPVLTTPDALSSSGIPESIDGEPEAAANDARAGDEVAVLDVPAAGSHDRRS